MISIMSYKEGEHWGSLRQLRRSSPHMRAFGPRLMQTSEARPPQSLRPLLLRLTQQLEQAAQFRHTQFDALIVGSRFFCVGAMTASYHTW
jgi:hypothetical protein